MDSASAQPGPRRCVTSAWLLALSALTRLGDLSCQGAEPCLEKYTISELKGWVSGTRKLPRLEISSHAEVACPRAKQLILNASLEIFNEKFIHDPHGWSLCA